MSARPRVLITEGEQRASLAAARALRTAGYDVVVTASGRSAPAWWSRHVRVGPTVPDARDRPAAFVEALVEHLRTDRYDALLPGSEATLVPLSERRSEVEPFVPLGFPPAEVVGRALDKGVLAREAEQVGLDVPHNSVCAGRDEVFATAASVGYPVIVKPLRSFFTDDAGRFRQSSALIARDEGALTDCVAALGLPVLVQAYQAASTLVSCAGVRLPGGIAGVTVSRYDRTWPPIIGSASLARTVEPEPAVVRATTDLLDAIGWVGIFELEFLDLGAGRLAAIDLNPRIFGWIALAVRAGANLPAIWCDYVRSGAAPASVHFARPAVRYRWEDGEFNYFLHSLGRRRFRAALSILRPYRRVVHPYFVASDPGPFLAQAYIVLRRRWAARRHGEKL